MTSLSVMFTDAGVFDFSDVFRINAARLSSIISCGGYLPPACLVDAGEECADTPAFFKSMISSTDKLP